jgi:hypothetical protein
MDRPIVTQMAEAVYAELPDKIRQVDADNGYPHLIYIEAHCRPMAIIYEMVRDHSGIEGWATLWQTNPQAPAITDEITQVPDEAIRFAAQFLGQRLPAGLNTVDVHQRYTEIKDRTRRGGRRSIFKALAKAVYGDSYYTGPETDLEDTPGLWILERPNGNAWRLLVSMDKDLMPESDTQQVNIVAPSDFAVQSSGTGQVVTFTALNRAIDGGLDWLVTSTTDNNVAMSVRYRSPVNTADLFPVSSIEGSVSGVLLITEYQVKNWNNVGCLIDSIRVGVRCYDAANVDLGVVLAPTTWGLPVGPGIAQGTIGPTYSIGWVDITSLLPGTAKIAFDTRMVFVPGPAGNGARDIYIRQNAGILMTQKPVTVTSGDLMYHDAASLGWHPFTVPGGSASAISERIRTTIIRDALAKAKPMGMMIDFNLVSGGDYAALLAAHADYNELLTDFAAYQDIMNNPSKT